MAMSNKAKSRWADDEEDAALDVQRKHEKEAKKKAKAERQRKLEEEEARRAALVTIHTEDTVDGPNPDTERPAKRRRLSPEPDASGLELQPTKLLRFPAPEWGPCRHFDNFEKLNHIEEGSYGWVSRAKEITTGEIVALKKLKMDNANDGFPVTGLREIQTLMASRHPNIVALREIVMGDKLS
ncbi:MAG: hypothetical protein Q9164_007419, partial [Protoblastenia rupestris]